MVYIHILLMADNSSFLCLYVFDFLAVDCTSSQFYCASIHIDCISSHIY